MFRYRNFLLALLFVWGQGHAWIVKEEFLSPERQHFDCHGSAIIETVPGHLCCVWKGGPGVGQSNRDIKENVGVWISLYNGREWAEPKEIVSAKDSVAWNPVLCKLSETDVLLFFRIGKDPRSAASYLKRSFDGGETWEEEEMLPAGITGPTQCKPIITQAGTLICPAHVAVELKATAVWIDISEDQGRHWKKVGPLEIPNRKFGAIEPALFYDAQGNLKMMCRDRANKIGEKGYIWTALSTDDGNSWSEFKQTDLPNPDSGIDVVDLGEGVVVLLYNHSHTDRYPLHLAISYDGAESWSAPYILDACGEFPSGFLAANHALHVTYAAVQKDSEQRRIKHIVLEGIGDIDVDATKVIGVGGDAE